jgi:class 3 adenylate cyclase/tetratricopeptide (TPR) repeat protein
LLICPNCGEENPARFRLCGFCGTALAGVAPPPQEIRKTVTIVFSDLKGSTDLGERLDPEALREVMNRYFAAMSAELDAHGGTIEKFIGDAIMAVFGLPIVHEDDALRAVRAAVGMQTGLERLNSELDRTWGVRLAMRIGVHTGEVVAGDPAAGQRLVTGDPVNTAARLEQAAPAGEVMLGELTYRLVRPHVDAEAVEPLELKGKAERVSAWRLHGLRSGKAAPADTAIPMVGRDDEMRTLRSLLDDASRRGAIAAVTVVGDAGVGKSRLIHEFLTSERDRAFTVRGRCLPYGRGITFWPIVEIVRAAAGVEEDDAPERAIAKVRGLVGDSDVADRLASATGLAATSFPVAEIVWAVRRLVEILADDRPVVVVFDDIHWAESTMLDLITHLAEADSSARALVISTTRHDLLDARPEWASTSRHERLVLRPLGDAQAAAIVEASLGGSGLPDRVVHRILEAAEGNPLYVEQLVSMLVDQGTVRQVDGAWRPADEIGDVAIPPTIAALLESRLDRLGRDERAVLEPASVIGLVFAESAVRTLAAEHARADLEGHLASLGRKRLVQRVEGDGDHETEASHRFGHILIRDTTYNSLLKRARADLHERFVAWADVRNAEDGRALEFEEILGYHLEQAHRYLAELGPLDDHGRDVGVRASERLGSAGQRAFARGDMPATANLLRRAALVRPRGDVTRIGLLVDAGDALMQSGEIALADETLASARDEAVEIGDQALQTRASLGSIYLRHVTGGDLPEGELVERVRSGIQVLEATGDERGLTRAWRILANVHLTACRYLDATEAVRRMIDHARRSGDETMERRASAALAACAQLGPMPVPEAIEVIESVRARIAGDRTAEADTLRALANLEAMRGDFEAARKLYRHSREILEQLGWRLDAALTAVAASGSVELLAGDSEAAEAELRRDHDALAAMGERNFISTTAALLAEALYRQGRDDEALAMTEESESIADADDVVTQYLWRSVRAKLLARAGDPERAEPLSREAIAIIGEAQDPDSLGYAYLDLGEVLRAADRQGEAIEAAERATALFDTKANAASAARARAFAAAVRASTATAAAPGR